MSRRGLGSIRKRSDGVYRVELTHGHDALTGKRRRLSEDVHGTQQDAERVLARMLLEIGQLPAGKDMTVRQFIEDLYKPWLTGRVRRETATGYQKKFDNHVLPKLGEVKLNELEPYVLDRWRNDLMATMNGTSARNVYRALSVALNRAVKWRLIPSNPMQAVDAPKPVERELNTLSRDEVSGYLRAFDGHELAPLVIVAIATGLRPSELYALTWADIDLHAGTVTVTRGLHQEKSEIWFEEPKSKRSHRTVSLPAWATQALTLVRGIGPLVPSKGHHAPPTEITRSYRRQILAKKLRFVPIRDLRHTHATLMLEAGVDIVNVSRRLGHSTVAITDKHYLRPKQSADQAAADAFNVFILDQKPLAVVGDILPLATLGDTTSTD